MANNGGNNQNAQSGQNNRNAANTTASNDRGKGENMNSGNFRNNPDRASEAGRKGGEN